MKAEVYNPREYWLDRGRRYMKERDYKTPYFLEQEELIVQRVRDLAPHSIIDIGCGFGRVTRRLVDAFPDASISGIDISQDQIDNARRYCPGTKFFCDDAYDTVLRIADVTVASELFLHIPLNELRVMIARILKSSQALVHDFDVFPIDNASPHVFAHNYAQIYRALGIRFQTWVGGSEPYGFITAYAA